MRLFHWLFPCVLKSVGLTICTKKFLGANMNAKLPNGKKACLNILKQTAVILTQ